MPANPPPTMTTRGRPMLACCPDTLRSTKLGARFPIVRCSKAAVGLKRIQLNWSVDAPAARQSHLKSSWEEAGSVRARLSAGRQGRSEVRVYHRLGKYLDEGGLSNPARLRSSQSSQSSRG